MAEIPNDPKFSPEYLETVKKLTWIHDHATPGQWAETCEMISLLDALVVRMHSTLYHAEPPKAEKPLPSIPRRGPLHLAWSRPAE